MFSDLRIAIRNLLKATALWQDNRLILREFKFFPGVTVAAISFSLFAACLSGSTVALIGVFLQGLTNPQESPIQTGLYFIDHWVFGITAPPAERIIRLSTFILFAIWLQSLSHYLGQLFSRLAAINLTERLRRSIFEQLQGLSLSFYSKTQPGELINSIRGETNQLQQAFNVISVFFTQGMTLLVYVGLMFFLSWQLSIAAFLVFGLLSICVSKITAKVREASFDVPTANGRFSSAALELINGIRTVHASSTHEYERQRFYKATSQVVKATSKVAKLSTMVGPLTQGMSGTLLILMVAIAFSTLVESGQMRATTLLTFLLTLSRTMPVVTHINGAWTKLNSFQGAFKNVKDLLKESDKPYLQNGELPFSELKCSIDFVAVNFGYEANEPVLHDITLAIAKGQTTALVGSSGAGKTTLADLIPRLYDPTDGKILVDGIDLRQFDIHTFRQKLAIVSQDTFIFNASVFYNIAYGLEGIDESAVWEAARQANALQFIQDLPDGLKTSLGDKGVRLSGGQRQRIAIARALLRNPEILILDEATSALDSVTERLIQESLENLSQGRTVIVIAHRLSTIVNADQVVVLEKGRVVEQGNYQELLNQKGELWKYHQMQFATG
ncbi:heterocyst formation ABC transporter subunit HepA [Acaryochloris marina]|uniref:ABC transporter, permease protein n=1 Tax=Acaryochloris marina (strain MBIC 11017) TaxID=329726 RepID=B0CGB4_ACAM1|nr:heterocyst formation ABC transporter subunit HepA [Acaryochloris marina]ABW30667.1 ABC transporter, permease protein [Acaryochloris marina MBIC11017]BDM79453.1 HlyB/MsbA family ABC transporter [Acaryochloris marina MBIC10699]